MSTRAPSSAPPTRLMGAMTPVEVEAAAPASLDPLAARLPGPDSTCPPLTPMRLSERYEAAA